MQAGTVVPFPAVRLAAAIASFVRTKARDGSANDMTAATADIRTRTPSSYGIHRCGEAGALAP